ncbi:MAG: 5'-nucleotidase C-terminal domain-containing protein [Chitinophagaceae bacterium]
MCVLLVFAAFFFISCHPALVPTAIAYKEYAINSEQPKDAALVSLMKPYKDSVLKSMSEVVGTTNKTLIHKRPEGTLGNFVVDAILYEAKLKFHFPIDIAIVNDDGLRIDRIAAGNVTKWDIFNVMPFENLMVAQKIRGDVLQQYLDLIAGDGGWPVAGMTMQIKGSKAVNVLIGGKPLAMDKMYTVINSDYIANGGKNASMLKNIPQQNSGYLLRDAIFDFIKAKENIITSNEENRVTNAQ